MRLTRSKRLLTFITLSLVILNLSLSFASDSDDKLREEDVVVNGIPIEAIKPEQEVLMEKSQEKFEFQSDISRLMKVVVSHLYHDRDVFLRELVSNSGDALEKLRFASLTDPTVLDTAPALNISIIADKPSKRLIIRDSGVGMTREELQKNLGTIARSGTSEFLSKLEKGSQSDKASGTSSNLIGQFGLGFYSSFLVADKVLVSSKSNADDKQWIFQSDSNAAEFKISEDPRGPSLGRGTEITLYLKDDATEFLEVEKLKKLISTHSEYSTTAPIYIWTEKDKSEKSEEEEKEEDKTEKGDNDDEGDNKEEEKDGDIKVDDEDEDADEEDESEKAPKTKIIKQQEWEQINTKGPIWTRDPKTVTDEEYISFYKSSTGKSETPTSWVHFKGDAGRTSFHGLIYIPDTLPADFYSKTYAQLDSVKLFVRKVLITKEPSPDFIPKWLNWIKVIIDADDLPLNVGRDSLQVTKSLKQIQNIVLKKFLDHLGSLSKKDPKKYTSLWTKIGTTLKVGAVEDTKNREKIAKLMRFQSSQSEKEEVSLEDYTSRRKKNQKQIYYIAGTGVTSKDLSKSPFVEKLVARGYEVLYLTEPMDEMLATSLATFDGMKFQDVAKKGLEMGDEEEDEAEKKSIEEYKTQFEPLSKYIKKELEEFVGDVVISNRLTTSPCAVVADSYAWTGNMERLMAAQNQQKGGDSSNFMLDFIKKAKKTFEINPKHPLIQGLLNKVEEAGEDDLILRDELKHVIRVLWDTSLVRSGFTVADSNVYFQRIEILLRKSIGVDELAKVEVGDIKPAPPIEEGPLDGRSGEEKDEKKGDEKIQLNSDGTSQSSDESKQDWQDWSKVKEKLKATGSDKLKKEGEEIKQGNQKNEENDKEDKDKEGAEKDEKRLEEENKDVDEDEEEDDDDSDNNLDDDFDFSSKNFGEDLPDMKDFKEKLMKDFGPFKDEL
ncbi:Hsp90 protein-domain-containing protein [Phakopsora pachyrhizi]|nr:Hsp90 protein-domain-containing protein [Phakopsora pachyrhizi]